MIRYKNDRLNCKSYIPAKLSSVLSKKYKILILHFQLFLNVTLKTGVNLLGPVGPLIQNKDTNLRKAIPAAEQLMLTMRVFTSGDSQVSLS